MLSVIHVKYGGLHASPGSRLRGSSRNVLQSASEEPWGQDTPALSGQEEREAQDSS